LSAGGSHREACLAQIVTLIEQASNGAQWLTSAGLFITPAKAGVTFQWKLQFVDDSSPPVVVSGPGNFWARVNDCSWIYHHVIRAVAIYL